MNRAALERELALLRELERRKGMYPLAWAQLWHREAPRTSQRLALLPLLQPELLMLGLLGGNRTGKSEVGAMYAVAMAGGRDAWIDGPGGRVYWVRRWLELNGLPDELIPLGPGRVWVGSPTFSAAVEQIRPKLLRWAPVATTTTAWDDQRGQGTMKLPGGGIIVSKAYKQYDQDPDTWEGAGIRAIVLDEQPNQRANLTAALSRLVDQGGKILNMLTPLRGMGDWYYKELVHNPPDWLRIVYLHGEDNPHIPQDRRRMMIAATPRWQRASRDKGIFTSPEGAIYPMDRGIHVIPPMKPPEDWLRWHSTDWGGRAPHMLWAAESPQGDLVVYRELAPRRSTQEPAITPRQLLGLAKEMEESEKYAGTTYRVADSEDPAAIVEAAELGWWIEPAQKKAGSVLLGIGLLESMLQTVHPITMEPQQPRIRITSDCPQLLEELEGMRWAEVREGQEPRPAEVCPDHGPDALRYLVKYRELLGFR